MKKEKKIIILSSIILGVLVLTLGIAYALFSYQQTGNNTSQLIMGDIYMHYKENNQLILNNAMPQEGFKTLLTGYKVNPIMAEQDASDTTTELYACINLFQNDWGWGLDEGEDFESLCKGTGTSWGWTLQMLLDDMFTDEYGYNELLSLNIIQEETIEYTSIKMNPEIATQTAEYENELTACVNLFQEWYIDFGSTAETFCQGTGTADGDMTFQDHLDDWMINNNFAFEYMTTNNIIIQDGDSYIVNPDMVNQEVGEINELTRCVSLVTSFGYEFDEGTTAESFCKGEGTYDGGITLKGEFEGLKDNIDYMTFVGSKLLDNNIILASSDLPYFEFTISGKNTYSEKDIYYEIKLDYGDPHETRNTRLEDNFLKFRFVEVNPDKTEKIIFDNESYGNIKNKKIHTEIISQNTMNKINKTYRLYMWINEDVVIGNIDEDYTIEEWNDVFASVKVNVSGNLVIETVTETFIKNIEKSTDETCDPIIEDEDGTIYLSGDNECIDFNYVWYSGKLWRITAINPDGTLKMITEDVITSITWGKTGTISETDLTSAYPDSYVRQWLNQEFLPTLYNYENIIVTDYSDKTYKWNATTVSGYDWNSIDKITLLEDSVGLLNTYEYYQGYRNSPRVFEDTFLNTEKFMVFINPSGYSYANYTGCDVSYCGVPEGYSVDMPLAIRPVVNLLSSIEFSDGDGTYEKPYVIKFDRESVVSTNTLINTRSSGEYVKIEGDSITNRKFRIVDTQTIDNKLTTKLVSYDYVVDTFDSDLDGDKTEILSKKIGPSNLWNEISEEDETYWKGYLNNTWLKELDPMFNEVTGESSILEKGIYYLGYYDYKAEDYKNTVCNVISVSKGVKDCIKNRNVVENIWQGYVGFLRVGEMFTSVDNNVYDDFFLITPSSSFASLFYVQSSNALWFTTSSWAARPTINLKSNLVIKSGSGTEQDPFVVGLPS